MLTALILVCSLAITPELRNCDRNNALQVLQVPEQFGNPVMCMMRGQAYLAGTSIGQEMHDTEQVKVLCIRSGRSRGVAACTSPRRGEVYPCGRQGSGEGEQTKM